MMACAQYKAFTPRLVEDKNNEAVETESTCQVSSEAASEEPSTCSTVDSHLDKLKRDGRYSEEVKKLERARAKKELQRQATSFQQAAEELARSLEVAKGLRDGAGPRFANVAETGGGRTGGCAQVAALSADLLTGDAEDLRQWRDRLSLGLGQVFPTTKAHARTDSDLSARGSGAPSGLLNTAFVREQHVHAKTLPDLPVIADGLDAPSTVTGISTRVTAFADNCDSVSQLVKQTWDVPQEGFDDKPEDNAEQEAMWRARIDLFFEHFEPWPSMAFPTTRSAALLELLSRQETPRVEDWTVGAASQKEALLDTQDATPAAAAAVGHTNAAPALPAPAQELQTKGVESRVVALCIFVGLSLICLLPLLAKQV